MRLLAPAVIWIYITGLLYSVNGQCAVNNVNECVYGEISNMGFQSEQFCTNGLKILEKAETCMRQCNFEFPADFVTIKNQVNSRCSQDAACTNITDRYSRFVRCYDDYGGSETILSDIINDFHLYQQPTKEPTPCTKLSWSHSCQNLEVNECRYLAKIRDQMFIDDPKTAVAVRICGSEIKLNNRINECNTEQTISNINDRCALAEVTIDNVGNICSILQTQLDCILRETSTTCYDVQRIYLIPRLDTYAVFNLLFGCSITMYSIKIQPRESNCRYSNLITECFNQISSKFPEFNSDFDYTNMLSIFNVKYTDTEFCSQVQNFDGAKTCLQDVLKFCNIPHAGLYREGEGAIGNFYPEIGPFALNSYGYEIMYQYQKSSCTTPRGRTTPPPTPKPGSTDFVSKKVTPGKSTFPPTPGSSTEQRSTQVNRNDNQVVMGMSKPNAGAVTNPGSVVVIISLLFGLFL